MSNWGDRPDKSDHPGVFIVESDGHLSINIDRDPLLAPLQGRLPFRLTPLGRINTRLGVFNPLITAVIGLLIIVQIIVDVLLHLSSK